MTGRPIGITLPYLRAWRLRAVLKQGELAQRAGVARSTVVRAERAGSISLDNVRALAHALGVSVDELRFVDPDAPAGESKP